MRENYTLIRLFIDASLGVSLSENKRVELTKDQAHYLGTVLRRKVGDELRIFNGNDGEWRAVIVELSRKGGAVTCTEPLRGPKPMPDIWLCFAPVRKHRTAFIIEKGTELGVSEFHPVQTERTQFPKLNVEKLRLQAVEAAEQTERLDVPTVHALSKGGLASLLGQWPKGRALIFADEAGDATSALDALQKMPQGPAALLTGPEGGFTPKEREMLRAETFVVPVSLGPRILRADTAALSLLTLWQAVQGDWG